MRARITPGIMLPAIPGNQAREHRESRAGTHHLTRENAWESRAGSLGIKGLRTQGIIVPLSRGAQIPSAPGTERKRTRTW